MIAIRSIRQVTLAGGLFYAIAGHASCGSAFCMLNTQWDTQGVSGEPGHWRLDLRYEYVNQDHLREGKRNLSTAEDIAEHPDKDATELQTINRNLLASIDYAIDSHWGISASLPVVSRKHSHIADAATSPTFESWDFSRLSDARLIGRYQFDRPANSADSFGVQLGAKLPTGKHDVANGEGTVAERALQPGTGSTDLIVGAYYAHRPLLRGFNWFAQAQFQRAISTRDDFRPGDQVSLNGGVGYPLGDKVSLLMQINALHKQRDSGANAEPELSGGRFVYASPGVSVALTADTQAYAFYQKPIYRDVNGVQLTADRAFVVGLSLRF